MCQTWSGVSGVIRCTRCDQASQLLGVSGVVRCTRFDQVHQVLGGQVWSGIPGVRCVRRGQVYQV